MLNHIIESLGVGDPIDKETNSILLSFNEELPVNFSVINNKYLLLEYDCGDIINDKETNEYLFNKLAQVCFGGYYNCPSWLNADKKKYAYILTSKLYISKFTDQERKDYIDTFLTLCDNVREEYIQLTMSLKV